MLADVLSSVAFSRGLLWAAAGCNVLVPGGYGSKLERADISKNESGMVKKRELLNHKRSRRKTLIIKLKKTAVILA
jgi:hypothetical protein